MAKAKKLQPGDMVTARAKDDFGYHPTLGEIVKGQEYVVDAAVFPLEILERPKDVQFPFEVDPVNTNDTTGGEAP